MPLFQKKPKTTPIQIRVIQSTAMRLDDWRASPELVAYARRLNASPEFQTMLNILRNESPSSFGLGLGATHDDQIAHSYKATGYNLCLNNLDSMAQLSTDQPAVEATFAPENRTEPA